MASATTLAESLHVNYSWASLQTEGSVGGGRVAEFVIMNRFLLFPPASRSVATLKSMHWPSANIWMHEENSFAPFSPHTLRVRSRTQCWIEKHVCGALFIAFPILWAMVEICVLAGVTDEGLNMKTHIYGDGVYQSPIWRYSSEAELRTRFVSNGSGNMTSRTVFSNYSMLRDRPSSEIAQCLANDYVMPFNALQPSATGSFSEFWSMIDVFMARPDWLWAFTHWLVSRRAKFYFSCVSPAAGRPETL